MNDYVTLEEPRLPLLHLLLKLLDPEEKDWEKLLKFWEDLGHIISQDYGVVCSQNQKAAEAFPEQALRLMCKSSQAGYEDIVEAMIASGADPNQTDTSDTSPLMHSATSGQLEVIKKLLLHGASVDLVNTKQESSLHRACANCQWEAARLLLQNGANIQSKDQCGDTPLNAAIESLKVKLSEEEESSSTIIKEGTEFLKFIEKECLDAELVQLLSPTDAAMYGLQTVVEQHEYRHDDIKEAMKVAAKYGQTHIIQCLASKMDANNVPLLIDQMVSDGAYEAVDQLVRYFPHHRPKISLKDACFRNLVNVVDSL